jgi:hypothetical protein
VFRIPNHFSIFSDKFLGRRRFRHSISIRFSSFFFSSFQALVSYLLSTPLSVPPSLTARNYVAFVSVLSKKTTSRQYRGAVIVVVVVFLSFLPFFLPFFLHELSNRGRFDFLRLTKLTTRNSIFFS